MEKHQAQKQKNRIKIIRESLKMSFNDLSEKSGIKYGTLWNIENHNINTIDR